MKVGDPKGAVSMALDNISTQVPTKTSIEDSPEAIMEAAKAFEAVFLNEIMKSMRKTLPEDGLLNSGFANGVFNSMLDQEYAQIASRSGQVGLSHMIALQLNRGAPLDVDDIPAGDAPSRLESRRMSASHLESSRAHALRAVPPHLRAASPAASSAVGADETLIVDGEEVPAWLFEEVTEESPPEDLVLDSWVPPTPPSAPSAPSASLHTPAAQPSALPEGTTTERSQAATETRQRRAVSAYQRLKR